MKKVFVKGNTVSAENYLGLIEQCPSKDTSYRKLEEGFFVISFNKRGEVYNSFVYAVSEVADENGDLVGNETETTDYLDGFIGKSGSGGAFDKEGLSTDLKLEELNQQIKKQGEDTVLALSNLPKNNIIPIVGLDSGNGNLPLIQRTDTSDDSIKYFDFNGDNVTASFVGPFVITPNLEVKQTYLRATSMGIGYEIDDIIILSEVINQSTATSVSKSYENITKDTQLVTTNVVRGHFSTNLEKPEDTDSITQFKVNSNTGVISGLLFKKLRDDESVIYKNTSSGTVSSSPVLVEDEYLVNVEKVTKISQSERVWEANTLKSISIVVDSGSTGVYDILENDVVVHRINEETVGLVYGTLEVPESYIQFKIEVVEVVAGSIRLNGERPGGLNSLNTNQIYVDAKSVFIGDPNLIAGNPTLIATFPVPNETGSTAVFTNTSTSLVKGISANGKVHITDPDRFRNITISDIVSLSRSVCMVGMSADFSSNGTVTRFANPGWQIGNISSSFFITVDGNAAVSVPRANLNFTTDEESKLKGFVLYTERITINSGADFKFDFYVINENNPTGFLFNSQTVPITANTSTQYFVTYKSEVHYFAQVDLDAKDGFINISKEKAGV